MPAPAMLAEATTPRHVFRMQDTMKKILVAGLIGTLLLAATSCGTARRAGKDLAVTLASPAIILYGAGTDGAIDARNIQKGLDSSDAVAVLAFPFTFLYRAVDHGLSCLVHAGDFFVSPIYGLAELGGHPDTKIQPLMIYRGFLDADEETTVDVATGENAQR